MKIREETLLFRVTIGWVTLLLLLTLMLVVMMYQSVYMNNGFRRLFFDPGPRGLPFVLTIALIYALMPVFVQSVSGLQTRAFRWIAVIVASFGAFFFVLHHLEHALHGERKTFSANVVDVAIHVIGIWVILNSVRWARIRWEPKE